MLEQLFSVLITPTGTLTYHLLLAFSIAGALFFAMADATRKPAVTKRLLIGLGALLAIRLVLFVVSSLVWQGVVDGELWLPLLDRAAGLLGLLLIVWLWAFPQGPSGADSALILLGLLVVTIILLGAVWWAEQGADITFNHSMPDIVAQWISIGLASLGILALILLHPENWIQGVIMLLILLAGHVVYLISPVSDDNYAIAVRLAQMVAFPFLILLPGRYAQTASAGLSEHHTAVDKTPGTRSAGPYPEATILATLQKVAAERDPDRISRAVTKAVSKVMDADVCLMIMPPEENGMLHIRCGYDRKQGRYLSPKNIDGREAPVLVSALKIGRTRILDAANSTSDVGTLAVLCGIEHTGDVLYTPILSAGGDLEAIFTLLSPYSERSWSTEDGSFLGLFGRYLVQILQRSEDMNAITLELDHERQAALGMQEQAKYSIDQSQKLEGQLAVLNEDLDRDKSQLASMASIIAAGSLVQEKLERMRAENEELSAAAERAGQASHEHDAAAEAEMRLALEEISYLQNALSEANRKTATIKASVSGAGPSNAQLAEIDSIARDLRSPLSSIVGYTDFLMAESVGILGKAQRKYMERIRISAERLGRSVDDLMQASSVDGGLMQLANEEIDLRTVVENAVAETYPELELKQINLAVDLPSESMPLIAERSSVQKVFSNLLSNASAATPEGGDVHLRAKLEQSDTDKDYILVQVEDTGSGIAAKDLHGVFSPRPPGLEISGLGVDGDDLPTVKALVEVFGGRIWVDSELGKGSTFSVLLPVAQPEQDSEFMDGGL